MRTARRCPVGLVNAPQMSQTKKSIPKEPKSGLMIRCIRCIRIMIIETSWFKSTSVRCPGSREEVKFVSITNAVGRKATAFSGGTGTIIVAPCEPG